MGERPKLSRLEREGEIATIVLDNPAMLNAWRWESARQISGIGDDMTLGYKAMAAKEKADFEGK